MLQALKYRWAHLKWSLSDPGPASNTYDWSHDKWKAANERRRKWRESEPKPEVKK